MSIHAPLPANHGLARKWLRESRELTASALRLCAAGDTDRARVRVQLARDWLDTWLSQVERGEPRLLPDQDGGGPG